MPEREVLVSKEGLKKLEDELEQLKTVKRREVAERIKIAREFGDISENSEYEDAKNEQAFVEGRIQNLEKMLRQAQVVDEGAQDPEHIHIGSRVTVQDIEEGVEEIYEIVGSTEADPIHNKISNDSPVGKALLGRQPGESIEVNVPIGKVHLKILSIS